MSISDYIAALFGATFLMSGMLSGFIALSKDRSWLGFALIGLLLGPLGLIVTGFAQPAAPTVRLAGEDPDNQNALPSGRGRDHIL